MSAMHVIRKLYGSRALDTSAMLGASLGSITGAVTGHRLSQNADVGTAVLMIPTFAMFGSTVGFVAGPALWYTAPVWVPVEIYKWTRGVPLAGVSAIEP